MYFTLIKSFATFLGIINSLILVYNLATDPEVTEGNYWYISRPFGAAYFKVGEVRDGVDSDLAGWGRGGLSYRGRPGRTI